MLDASSRGRILLLRANPMHFRLETCLPMRSPVPIYCKLIERSYLHGCGLLDSFLSQPPRIRGNLSIVCSLFTVRQAHESSHSLHSH